MHVPFVDVQVAFVSALATWMPVRRRIGVMIAVGMIEGIWVYGGCQAPRSAQRREAVACETGVEGGGFELRSGGGGRSRRTTTWLG